VLLQPRYFWVELDHPLGLKWELHKVELQRDSKGIKEYWEVALSNLKSAHARVAARYDAGRGRASFELATGF
jgi:hypothetical protein